MWKLFGSKEKRISLPIRERVNYAALITVGFFLIAAASSDLYASGREYIAACSEYEQLREQSPFMPAYRAPASQLPISQGTGNSASNEASDLNLSLMIDSEISDTPIQNSEYQIPDSPDEEPPNPLAGLAEMNPDFVGWISIDGVIDYPVVRGRDNSRYLRVTFSGQRNSSGAIFMDYRNTSGFYDSVCIIYGHNMRDGSMFAQLNRYADPAFLADNPDIMVMTADGEVLEYRIFAAKQVYAWDSTYDLDFADVTEAAKAFDGAPDNAANFLLLSTCTPSAEKNDRILVFAAPAG